MRGVYHADKVSSLKKAVFYRINFISKKIRLGALMYLKKKTDILYISIFIPKLMTFHEHPIPVYSEHLENNLNVDYGKD